MFGLFFTLFSAFPTLGELFICLADINPGFGRKTGKGISIRANIWTNFDEDLLMSDWGFLGNELSWHMIQSQFHNSALLKYPAIMLQYRKSIETISGNGKPRCNVFSLNFPLLGNKIIHSHSREMIWPFCFCIISFFCRAMSFFVFLLFFSKNLSDFVDTGLES